MMREETTAECVVLEERAFSIKKRLLAMHLKAHAGHVGSSLSCAELLTLLKFAWMRGDDSFVLSKGHAATALYSLLAEVNVLSASQIDSYLEDGTGLPAHPPFSGIKEIPSDGELDEGSVWEAALFIAHHRLKNLVWIIDRNHLQGIGRTEEVLALEPLAAKLCAFGYHVVGADGHDFPSLLAARDECAQALHAHGKPVEQTGKG